MIALDLDGTLLDEERMISERNQQAIKKALAAGKIVCIATGRGIKSALEHVQILGLNGPYVTANGSEVWADETTLLSRHNLEHSMVARLIEVADRLNIWYWSYTQDGLLSRENFDGDIERVNWLKLGFYDEDVSKLKAAYSVIKDWPGLEISNSHPKNIEINPPGINKAVGLRVVCERLGLSMSEVIACGDSLNDTEMIKAVGLGVAMGNAQPEVKQVADAVTVTNEEHGVAETIETYLLGEG